MRAAARVRSSSPSNRTTCWGMMRARSRRRSKISINPPATVAEKLVKSGKPLGQFRTLYPYLPLVAEASHFVKHAPGQRTAGVLADSLAENAQEKGRKNKASGNE